LRLDPVVIHAEDLSQTVGEFYGTPIREVNLLAVGLREIRDAQFSAQFSLGEDAPKVELLPGEVITDNVIRRSTTAEAVGEKFYEEKPQVSFEESISGLMPPDYWDDYYAR